MSGLPAAGPAAEPAVPGQVYPTSRGGGPQVQG